MLCIIYCIYLYLVSPCSCDSTAGCDFLHSHLVFFMCYNLFLCILVSLRPSCKIAACLVRFGWPVAARMLVKSTWFFHETGKAELHLQRSGRDVIRCLICCSICSVIIVEYLSILVMFCFVIRVGLVQTADDILSLCLPCSASLCVFEG